jgi:transcriptional regulator NrdR family protein
MTCPACGHDATHTIDGRPTNNNAFRRRHECKACRHRFTTYERIEADDPAVLHNAAMIIRGELAHLLTAAKALDEACRAVTG